MFIIVKGEVDLSNRAKGNIKTMRRGEFFGEMALLNNAPRTATITAVTEVKCISLNRSDIFENLGEELQPILYRNSMITAMEQDTILSKLTEDQKNKIAQSMQISFVQEGHLVID